MIKFFRHIRLNLMETGKTAKYFKYAIGEIILVVIGILIALSINNWNERTKLKIEEQKLISSLIKEIESNVDKLKISINNNQTIVKMSSTFLKNAASNQDFDYKVSNIPSLFAYSSNKIESSILNEILGTNSRALISNETFIEQLRVLKRNYNRSLKTEFYVDEYWNNQIAQLMNELGLGIYMTSDGLFKNRKVDFEITNSFLSSLSLMNGYQQSLLRRRQDMAKVLDETLKLLKQ